MKQVFLLILLSAFVSSEELKFAYHYGLHDFMVEDKTHVLGINTGFYTRYSTSEDSSHKAHFQTFTEYDKKELDPDHIPVWFSSQYAYTTLLVQPEERFKINAIVNWDWKMNTASSVEQYLKSGIGIEGAFEEYAVKIVPKILLGTYYLEIDMRDYPRLFFGCRV
ncbi:MAG: hypothetical protein Q9M36_08525 [Sulfurovum sp.]|nr:hypothetical protein [Sulfurovum sp.]